MRRMNRRTFIGSSVATTFLASKPTWAKGAAAGSPQLDRIGVQLYTVREMMKTDFEGTLAKVAAIGYSEVEFAGYFDHQPKDIRATLNKLHLTAPSEHVSYEVVQNKWPKALVAADVVGRNL